VRSKLKQKQPLKEPVYFFDQGTVQRWPIDDNGMPRAQGLRGIRLERGPGLCIREEPHEVVERVLVNVEPDGKDRRLRATCVMRT
jgi:hypothetical protein